MFGNLGDGVVAEICSSLQGLAADLSDWPRIWKKWVGILVMKLWLV
jgi:hypothetical protein